MRRLMIGLAALAVSLAPAAAQTPQTEAPEGAPPATAAAEAPSPYVVLEPDARIPFGADRINSFSVQDDDSIILRVGVREYYRATLWPGCGRDAQFENQIGIPNRFGGEVDRFTALIIDGRRCPIKTLDRIENPRVVRARAAEAAAQREG